MTAVLTLLGYLLAMVGISSGLPSWFPLAETLGTIKDSILISLLLAASMPLCYACVDAITRASSGVKKGTEAKKENESNSENKESKEVEGGSAKGEGKQEVKSS